MAAPPCADSREGRGTPRGSLHSLPREARRNMDHSSGTTLTTRYRLVTRSDFDGLVCAALLRELDMLEETTFVHPKDMQDGKVEITEHDITTNLPYVATA